MKPKNSSGKVCKHSKPMEFYNDGEDKLYCYSCHSEFKIGKRGGLLFAKQNKK